LALTLGLVTAAPAQAQLGFAADGPISLVFGGTPQLVSIRVHCNRRANPTAEPVERTSVTVCFRLFQEASGMAMPLRPAQPWKVLTLLPGQTLVETVSVEFPSVERATDGLVRWEAEDGSGLGSTRVRVLPPNVLGELNLLAGRGPVGVVDAAMESRATLERAGVIVEDLANRKVRHLEVVDLSPDPARGGLWATLLVNNRSKLFWYSARENTWHELLDQFFDWHLGQEDRLLDPHPAGVLVGRHLYEASTAKLRSITEAAGAQGKGHAETLALIGPQVVYWNGAAWGITGGQRLARLGGPGQGLEVGARLQPADETITRLLPTPASLIVVTRNGNQENAFAVWQVDP